MFSASPCLTHQVRLGLRDSTDDSNLQSIAFNITLYHRKWSDRYFPQHRFGGADEFCPPSLKLQDWSNCPNSFPYYQTGVLPIVWTDSATFNEVIIFSPCLFTKLAPIDLWYVQVQVPQEEAVRRATENAPRPPRGEYAWTSE